MAEVEAGHGLLVELSKVTERQGKNGPYLMWEFFDEHNTKYVGFTDAEVIMGNRTWTWLCMLGVPLTVGEQVDITQLVGVECMVFVEGEKDTVRMVVRSSAVIKKPKVVEPTKIQQQNLQDEAQHLFG